MSLSDWQALYDKTARLLRESDKRLAAAYATLRRSQRAIDDSNALLR